MDLRLGKLVVALLRAQRSSVAFKPGEESEAEGIYSILENCRCRGKRYHCAEDLDSHLTLADFTKVFQFCGKRLSVGLLACHKKNYEREFALCARCPRKPPRVRKTVTIGPLSIWIG